MCIRDRGKVLALILVVELELVGELDEELLQALVWVQLSGKAEVLALVQHVEQTQE